MSDYLWKSVVPVFETTPGYQALQRSRQSAAQAVVRELRQAPWTTGASLSRTSFSESPERALDYGRASDWTLGPSVRYQLREGFDATLRGSLTRNSLFEPNALGLGGSSANSLSLELGYDVLRGGRRGLLESQAQGAAAAFRRQLAQVEAQILSSRIRFVQEILALYLIECRIRQTRTAQDSVREAVESGRVQVKVKTISQQDYLNFLDLENSLARRIVGEEAERAAALERLLVYGPTASELGGKLAKEARCEPEIPDTLSRAQQLGDIRALAEAWSARLPSAQAARARQDGAVHSLRASRVANRPALRPFLGGTLQRDELATFNSRSLAVGVQFEWNIPGEKGEAAVAASAADERAAVTELRVAVLEGAAQILSVKASLDAQANVAKVLNRSIENSRELLRVLQIQKRIGTVNSINFATAYLNQIDAAVALINSWGTLESAVYELTEYSRFQDREKEKKP